MTYAEYRKAIITASMKADREELKHLKSLDPNWFDSFIDECDYRTDGEKEICEGKCDDLICSSHCVIERRSRERKEIIESI